MSLNPINPSNKSETTIFESLTQLQRLIFPNEVIILALQGHLVLNPQNLENGLHLEPFFGAFSIKALTIKCSSWQGHQDIHKLNDNTCTYPKR